ncbi:exodeoxyribonuclease III [Hyphomicrobiales bacterium]|nr:exodeoxyribonuclease III [Hyphomicrobiales bacterium]MDC3272051.1 exodeoxyribonuclease III [Hyphomicrobiales bacterium]
MKIVTWNINSIRLRLPSLLDLISTLNPDIICLQETKCPDDKFPYDELIKIGFQHIAIKGQPSYNGVAILSKVKIKSILHHDFCNKKDSRYIGIETAKTKNIGPLIIHNFYVPAGGDEPNPEINEKFQHKLLFLDEMKDYLSESIKKPIGQIVTGDLNIAPHENDVWSHKALKNIISHTEIEINKLNTICNPEKWCDALRHEILDSEKIYTWWSYRNKDWEKSNRGRRLDHIWITKNIEELKKDILIYKNTRNWDRPSDHVPVMITI